MRSVPILIVGGGAAGMMAAAAVSGCGKKALIIEKMNQLGKKILATGNGRCNYTNLRFTGKNSPSREMWSSGCFISLIKGILTAFFIKPRFLTL